MQLTDYIVLDSAGRPVRGGRCRMDDFGLQARAGEAVIASTDALQRRLQEQRQAEAAKVAAIRAARQAAPSALTVLIEALRGKGVEITPADMDAARTRLEGSGARPE